MLTIIAFLVTILGSVNWLTIGLLQYDFIAGIFGFQASIFSRIIYIVFGIASVFLVFKLFKGKGTIAVFSRRNKKDLAKNLAKIGIKEQAQTDVESGEEFMPRRGYDHPSYDEMHDERLHSANRPMFDEHFDDRRGDL